LQCVARFGVTSELRELAHPLWRVRKWWLSSN
jgi:hypothetical protein